MHSYRDVAITITKADSGQPVASLPFRVIYDYSPCDSPLVYHMELRTPREVQAETDENGRAMVNLADYAWGIRLEVNAKERGYSGWFFLNKKLIRNGGVVEQERYGAPALACTALVSPDLARHTLPLLEGLRSATILIIAKPNAPTDIKTPNVNIRKQSNGSNGGEVLSGMKARTPKYPSTTIARPATTVYQNLRLAFITWCRLTQR
jgi:hypothetical protein